MHIHTAVLSSIYKESISISIKMSKDVGIPKSRETSAFTYAARQLGDEGSIYEERQGIKAVYMQQNEVLWMQT